MSYNICVTETIALGLSVLCIVSEHLYINDNQRQTSVSDLSSDEYDTRNTTHIKYSQVRWRQRQIMFIHRSNWKCDYCINNFSASQQKHYCHKHFINKSKQFQVIVVASFLYLQSISRLTNIHSSIKESYKFHYNVSIHSKHCRTRLEKCQRLSLLDRDS